jgi:sulfite reductase alpha subunit-like flavoprotein
VIRGEAAFKLLDEGAHIYFYALKGMTPEIQHTLSRVAKAKGENWEMKLSYIHEEQVVAMLRFLSI